MDFTNISGGERLEFRQIILSYLKMIMEISLRSNKDGENLNLYISSIESLSDVLIPFFDEQMNKEFDEFEEDLISIKKENSEQLSKLNPSEYSKGYANIHSAKMKRTYRNLFRKLNLLLKRNDYLQQSLYGEDTGEIVEEKEGGEENERWK